MQHWFFAYGFPHFSSYKLLSECKQESKFLWPCSVAGQENNWKLKQPGNLNEHQEQQNTCKTPPRTKRRKNKTGWEGARVQTRVFPWKLGNFGQFLWVKEM